VVAIRRRRSHPRRLRGDDGALEKECLPDDTGNEGEAKGWGADSTTRRGRRCGAGSAGPVSNSTAVWFRARSSSTRLGGHDVLLSLGAIDDFDHSISTSSGRRASQGNPGAYQIRRVYASRASIRGKNVVAVRVFDHVAKRLHGPRRDVLGDDGPLAKAVPLAARALRDREAHPARVVRRVPHLRAPPSISSSRNSPAALFGA